MAKQMNSLPVAYNKCRAKLLNKLATNEKLSIMRHSMTQHENHLLYASDHLPACMRKFHVKIATGLFAAALPFTTKQFNMANETLKIMHPCMIFSHYDL